MVEQLTKALNNKNNEIRLGSTAALGAIKNVSSLGSLIDALKDNNQNIRLEAAMAIGSISDVRGIGPLMGALNDIDGAVRREAAWGLVKIGEPATDFLINELEKSPVHRWELVWALGEIKDPRAIEPLIEALKDPDVEVRREAAWALWFIGDERAEAPLKEALAENKALYEAEIALGNIGRQDMLDVLRRDLQGRIGKERYEKEAFENIKR
jgi:HEAT repeat protein